jgi:hypothetical protein
MLLVASVSPMHCCGRMLVAVALVAVALVAVALVAAVLVGRATQHIAVAVTV